MLIYGVASSPKKLIDCVSAKRFFSAADCLALLSSQTSVSSHIEERKRLITGSDYLLFTVTITIVTSLSYPARGIIARLCARTGAIGRPVEHGLIIARSLECPGCRGDKISTVPRVLPQKQCGTGRILPECLARPIS